jgi:hypothetical protein
MLLAMIAYCQNRFISPRILALERRIKDYQPYTVDYLSGKHHELVGTLGVPGHELQLHR